MPIGSYLSQWSGNVYLDGLDHFVKQRINEQRIKAGGADHAHSGSRSP
jgi:hypothetical protein